MKLRSRLGLAVLALFTACARGGATDDGPVLALMERPTDWQLAPVDRSHLGERAGDGWIKGAFYTGVMAFAIREVCRLP